MEKIRKLFTKENVFAIVFVIIALHPFIELDYLSYEILNSIGLPRLTTVINFIVYPLLVILVFFLCEKNRKKVFILFGIYAVIFAVYFVLHCQNAAYLQYNLHLTNNFVFLLSDEVIYFLTLLIPLVYIYVLYLSNISELIIKKISIALSFLTAVPIFLSNLFLFGYSTYDDKIIGNIIKWFSLPYNAEANHPRLYTSKFFFQEGNTTGILMFMVLPLLYYFLYKSNNKKEKISLSLLIIVQSLAMMMLATRIATYGAVLIPLIIFVVYVFLVIIKKETLKKLYIIFLLVLTTINAGVLKYSPAYQNQQLDAKNYGFLKVDDYQKEEGSGLLREGEDLEPYSEEWLNFYTYMFEAYGFLINITPPEYYTKFYSYKVDPKFWVDFIFNYELEERVSGRQVETIFFNYKYQDLNLKQKILGMGYGTFMRGGIVIERDFIQQAYTLGYLGFALVMLPWLLVTLYLGVKLLFGYKKGYWNFFNIILMMIIMMGLGSSLVSGHTMDQLSTSMVISLCCALLLKNLKKVANGKESC